jgi:hypothetical protein
MMIATISIAMIRVTDLMATPLNHSCEALETARRSGVRGRGRAAGTRRSWREL